MIELRLSFIIGTIRQALPPSIYLNQTRAPRSIKTLERLGEREGREGGRADRRSWTETCTSNCEIASSHWALLERLETTDFSSHLLWPQSSPNLGLIFLPTSLHSPTNNLSSSWGCELPMRNNFTWQPFPCSLGIEIEFQFQLPYQKLESWDESSNLSY